jgi:hypothetical protein
VITIAIRIQAEPDDFTWADLRAAIDTLYGGDDDQVIEPCAIGLGDDRGLVWGHLEVT